MNGQAERPDGEPLDEVDSSGFEGSENEELEAAESEIEAEVSELDALKAAADEKPAINIYGQRRNSRMFASVQHETLRMPIASHWSASARSCWPFETALKWGSRAQRRPALRACWRAAQQR